MIRTSDLVKRFGRHEALRGISVEVPEGSVFALLGPNGAGKTTAIKISMNQDILLLYIPDPLNALILVNAKKKKDFV